MEAIEGCLSPRRFFWTKKIDNNRQRVDCQAAPFPVGLRGTVCVAWANNRYRWRRLQPANSVVYTSDVAGKWPPPGCTEIH